MRVPLLWASSLTFPKQLCLALQKVVGLEVRSVLLGILIADHLNFDLLFTISVLRAKEGPFELRSLGRALELIAIVGCMEGHDLVERFRLP